MENVKSVAHSSVSDVKPSRSEKKKKKKPKKQRTEPDIETGNAEEKACLETVSLREDVVGLGTEQSSGSHRKKKMEGSSSIDEKRSDSFVVSETSSLMKDALPERDSSVRTPEAPLHEQSALSETKRKSKMAKPGDLENLKDGEENPFIAEKKVAVSRLDSKTGVSLESGLKKKGESSGLGNLKNYSLESPLKESRLNEQSTRSDTKQKRRKKSKVSIFGEFDSLNGESILELNDNEGNSLTDEKKARDSHLESKTGHFSLASGAQLNEQSERKMKKWKGKKTRLRIVEDEDISTKNNGKDSNEAENNNMHSEPINGKDSRMEDLMSVSEAVESQNVKKVILIADKQSDSPITASTDLVETQNPHIDGDRETLEIGKKAKTRHKKRKKPSDLSGDGSEHIQTSVDHLDKEHAICLENGSIGVTVSQAMPVQVSEVAPGNSISTESDLKERKRKKEKKLKESLCNNEEIETKTEEVTPTDDVTLTAKVSEVALGNSTGTESDRKERKRKKQKQSKRSLCKDEDQKDVKIETKMEEVIDATLRANDKEKNFSRPLTSFQRKWISHPTKKLLILDLNGILVDVVQMPCKLKPHARVNGKGVFRRPFYDEFLDFCFRTFNVGIWSSRVHQNVIGVLNLLMDKKRRRELVFCYGRKLCTITQFKTLENEDKPLVLKELRKLWDKKLPNIPWNKGVYNESNTFLLDDSPYKALRNPANTAIFPYPYQYSDAADCSLAPGGDIRTYLERLAEAENVQKFIEQNPFGQPAITEADPHWDFYSQIIEDDKTLQARGKLRKESRLEDENMSRGSQHKLDKFGPLARNGASDSESDDSYDIGRYKRGRPQSRNESPSPLDRRRSSPQRRKKHSLSRSWSPRNRRSRSRSPRSRRSRSRSPRSRRSRSRSPRSRRSRSRSPRNRRSRSSLSRSCSPRNRRSRSRSPRNRRSRSRSPRNQRSRGRSPSFQLTDKISGENKRGVKGQMPFCFDFCRGKCYHGVSCRYLHHNSGKSNESRWQRSKHPYPELPHASRTNNAHEDIKQSCERSDDGVHYQDNQSNEYDMVKSVRSRDIPASLFETRLSENKNEMADPVCYENCQEAAAESQHLSTIDTQKSCGNASQDS